jgi:hypothetical protein
MRDTNKKALLVGVNRYLDSNVSSLRFSSNDASAIHSILTDPKRGGFTEDKCIVITDKNKTKPLRSNLLSAIQTLAHTADSADYLLFFFSGHGIEKDGKSYLLPSDSRINVLCDTAIPIDWVKSTLAESKAKAKVLILDACHAGVMKGKSESGMMTKGFLDSISSPIEGFAVLSSCKMNEYSYEMPDTKHGVFSYYFIEGLKGAADYDSDGNITVSDLSRYTAEKVSDWSFKTQVQQTPNLFYQVVGDLLIAKVPSLLEKTEAAKPVIERGPTSEKLYLDGYRIANDKNAKGLDPNFCKVLTRFYGLHEIDYSGDKNLERVLFPNGWYDSDSLFLKFVKEITQLQEKLALDYMIMKPPIQIFLYADHLFDINLLSKWQKNNKTEIKHFDPKGLKSENFSKFLILEGTYSDQVIQIEFLVVERGKEKTKGRSTITVRRIDGKPFERKSFSDFCPTHLNDYFDNIWFP